jgi:hypothetical protein
MSMTFGAGVFIGAAGVWLLWVAVRAVRNAPDLSERWKPPLTDEQREANADRIWRSR